MAFSSLGVINWLDKAEMIKAAKEKEENKRESLAFEIAMKYGGSSFAGSGSGKGKSMPTNLATAALMKEYKLTEETLAPILASGDKSAAGRLLNLLEGQKQKYGEDGFDLPDEVVSGIVESAVISQPTTREIDFTEMEKFIGREMDSMYKNLLKSQSTDPGAVFFPEPVFASAPDLEDLNRFEKRAMKSNYSRAKDELTKIDSRLNTIRSMGDDANLTPDQIAERGWLTDRKTSLNSAIKFYDDGTVTPVASLYGTSSIKQLQKNFAKFKDDLIDPELLNATKQNIKVPQSMQQYMIDSLIRSKILREGDVVDIVSENGEIINQITIAP